MRAAAVASWQAKPKAVSAEWTCFRQTSPDWPPLYHNAGTPEPDQESGRWHRKGQAVAQYLSLSPLGAFAECARYYSLRSAAQAAEMRRNLWLVYVAETRIADLSTFEKYKNSGLDPAIAVQTDHERCRQLADDLRAAGFRGVLSPSAALADTTNLTLFGERYERVLQSDPAKWRNPDVNSWLPVQQIVEEVPVPPQLCTETVFQGQKHLSYREWATAQGITLGTGPP